MSGGELFDPLGANRAEAPRPGRRPSAPLVMAATVLAGLATLIGVAWLRDDGDRGKPRAVSTIEHVAPPQKPSTPPPGPAPQTAPAIGASALREDQEVEIQNGVRIIRPRRERPAPPGDAIRGPDVPAGR